MLKETIAALLAALNRRKIPFLFFGMEALNVYLEKEGGDSFGTKDSDFLLDSTQISPTDAAAALEGVAFPEEVHVTAHLPGRPDPVVLFDGEKWKRRRLPAAVTISVSNPDSHYSLDLVFGDPGIPFSDLWRKSTKARYHGVPVRIAAKEDILTLKRLAGREKDLLVLDRLRSRQARRREHGR